VRDTSENGGRLEEMVAHEMEEGALYPVSGIVAAPDGETLELVALSATDEAGEYRWIVLPEDEVRGSLKGGGGEGFVGQDINL
jgi:hypothetical protein